MSTSATTPPIPIGLRRSNGGCGEDGHHVFLDQGEVQAGDEWEKRLYERLGWADAVVCVVTRPYLRSVWAGAEIGAAGALHNELLPVNASGEDVPTAELTRARTHDADVGREEYGDVVRDPSGTRERLRARLTVIDEERQQQARRDDLQRRMRQRFDEKPNGVFVCYRREDSRWQAGRLADALVQRFGESAVFMDVDRVRIGNWRKQIDESLAECAAVIVVIGPLWHAELDSREAIKDLVRYEITQALRLGKTIIPL